jgi:hypothetical protein
MERCRRLRAHAKFPPSGILSPVYAESWWKTRKTPRPEHRNKCAAVFHGRARLCGRGSSKPREPFWRHGCRRNPRELGAHLRRSSRCARWSPVRSHTDRFWRLIAEAPRAAETDAQGRFLLEPAARHVEPSGPDPAGDCDRTRVAEGGFLRSGNPGATRPLQFLLSPVSQPPVHSSCQSPPGASEAPRRVGLRSSESRIVGSETAPGTLVHNWFEQARI